MKQETGASTCTRLIHHLLSEWKAGGKFTFSIRQDDLSALSHSSSLRSADFPLRLMLEGEGAICAHRVLGAASNGDGVTM